MDLSDVNPWWRLEGLKDSRLVKEIENIVESDRELRDYAYGMVKVDYPFPDILFRKRVRF